MSNFHPLEAVCRGSETQPKVLYVWNGNYFLVRQVIKETGIFSGLSNEAVQL